MVGPATGGHGGPLPGPPSSSPGVPGPQAPAQDADSRTGQRVVLYRWGSGEGRGFAHTKAHSRYDATRALLERSCLSIRCPQEDYVEHPGHPCDGYRGGSVFDCSRHYCWLTWEQLTAAAEAAFHAREEEYGTAPSMLLTELWVMDVPIEACVFLRDQVLVDYSWGEEK